MTNNAKEEIIPASCATLVRASSDDLARRGLRVEATEQARIATTRRGKFVSEMSPEEMRQALSTSSTTGLPSLRAFQETETDRAANVVAVSMLDWLGFVGSQRAVLVKAKADALREVQLDAYHDEDRFDRFLYRGESSEQLRSRLEKARTIFLVRTLEVSDPLGSRLFTGVDFTFGIGTSLGEAEAMERINRGKPSQGGVQTRERI